MNRTDFEIVQERQQARPRSGDESVDDMEIHLAQMEMDHDNGKPTKLADLVYAIEKLEEFSDRVDGLRLAIENQMDATVSPLINGGWQPSDTVMIEIDGDMVCLVKDCKWRISKTYLPVIDGNVEIEEAIADDDNDASVGW